MEVLIVVYHVVLVNILKETRPRVALLRADTSSLRSRMLALFLALAHPTILRLIVPDVGPLLVG